MHLKLALRKILCANNCKKSFTPFSRQRLHPTLDFLIKKAAVICSQAINMRKNGGGDGGLGEEEESDLFMGQESKFSPSDFLWHLPRRRKYFPSSDYHQRFFRFFPWGDNIWRPYPRRKKEGGKKLPNKISPPSFFPFHLHKDAVSHSSFPQRQREGGKGKRKKFETKKVSFPVSAGFCTRMKDINCFLIYNYSFAASSA